MKPTEEQIKKFWEWCGFYIEKDSNYPTLYEELFTPDSKHVMSSTKILRLHYPPIDLNNLFKYAVPKLIELNYSFDIWNGSHQMISLIDEWGVQLSLPTRVFHTEIQETLALALFWAINKVIEGNDKS